MAPHYTKAKVQYTMPIPIEEEFRARLHPAAVKGAGQFEPKLTFVQRCEILALDRVGSKRNQIAAAYKIARPTVAYICNPASKHYKNVRAELHNLGADRFIRQYLTDEVMQKYYSYVNDIHAISNDADEKIQRRTEAEGMGPNRLATGQKGIHRLHHPLLMITERIEILWENNAWRVYYRTGVFAGQMVKDPTDNPEGAFSTSQEALRKMLEWTGCEELHDE